MLAAMCKVHVIVGAVGAPCTHIFYPWNSKIFTNEYLEVLLLKYEFAPTVFYSYLYPYCGRYAYTLIIQIEVDLLLLFIQNSLGFY